MYSIYLLKAMVDDECETKESSNEICKKIENHLTEDVTFSTWNLHKAAQKFLKFHYNCQASTPYLGEEPEGINWATDNIGSWIAQHFYYLRLHCFYHDNIEYQTKINELFKIDGEQVSLLDIAHLFSMIDYESIKDTSVSLKSKFKIELKDN